MKKTLVSAMTRLCRAFLLAALALIGTNALHAQYAPGTNFWNSNISGINLGTASGNWVPGTIHQNWAIFALSGGVTITDPNSTGPADVFGNVGLGGSGNLSMSNSYINGTVYRAGGTETLAGRASYYTGGSTGGNNLTSEVNDALGASSAASALNVNNTGSGVNALVFGGPYFTSPSVAPGTIAMNNTTGSITGQAGQTYVLNMIDLVLQGASTILTLSGANTTNYVFNISRNLSLAAGAKILLSGGLTEANVLYNVKSNATQYDVTLSGASEAHGTILATTRAVKETGGSKVFGEVIAKTVSLSGASKVINPFASP